MKRFLIVPSLVLAVLLALCILNAAALNRRTNRWMDQADRIAQLAEQERWDMAREAMDDLSADWESAQDFLHVVIHHETLDAAQVTLTRCRTLCRLRAGGRPAAGAGPAAPAAAAAGRAGAPEPAEHSIIISTCQKSHFDKLRAVFQNLESSEKPCDCKRKTPLMGFFRNYLAVSDGG